MFAPPEKWKLSEHAAAKRYVSSETSNDAGPWSNARTPYLKEIMDCFTDPAVEEIVFMKPARIGGTEVINNAIGYYVDVDPCPILYVQQVEALAERYSKKIFTPMVRDNSHLASKISLTRSRNSDNTILEKSFPGGDITFVGANSHTGLRMVSKRIIICDDIDGFPLSAGKEGDPVDLAIKRADTFRGVRKYYLTSSPSEDKTSRIKKRYEASDKRIKLIPCPHCGTFQELLWGDDPKKFPQHLKWPGDKTFLAWYECPYCKGEIHEKHKGELLEAGYWQATAESKGIAGFKINGLYSPFSTWGELIDKFLAAYKEKDSNPEKLKVWVNTTLGETWEETSSDRKEDAIIRLADPHLPPGIVPPDVSCLLVLADTQQVGFYYRVVAFGWGTDLESWQIAEGFVESFDALNRVAFAEYKDRDGVAHHAWRGFIDSGGGTGSQPKHSRTAEVYTFCLQNPFWSPLKGRQTMTRLWSLTRIDYIPTLDGKQVPIPGGLNLYLINTTFFKDQLANKLRINPGDPGAFHLHSGLFGHETGDPAENAKKYWEDYARQMCAEVKLPKGTWDNPGNRANHYWDLGVYGFAAAEICQIKLWPRPEQANQFQEQAAPRMLSGGL
jgi:phage terminase large subunit GpA-like protein